MIRIEVVYIGRLLCKLYLLFTDYVEENITPKHVHPSEWKWAKIDFNIVLKNDSTIQELYNKIDINLIVTEFPV